MPRPSRLSRLVLAAVPVAALGLVAVAPGATAVASHTRDQHAQTPREHVTFRQWDFGGGHVRGRYDQTTVRHHHPESVPSPRTATPHERNW
jgi:hypothetical protein